MRDRDTIFKELKAYTEGLAYKEKLMAEGKAVVVTPEQRRDAIELLCDTLELLKAQEPREPYYTKLEYMPRLMTLEEIKALPDYVFLEDRDISHAFSIKAISRPALPQLVFVNISGEECVGFRGPDGDTSLVTSRYGVEWRCWTSRPTDAQRKAVKWD